MIIRKHKRPLALHLVLIMSLAQCPVSLADAPPSGPSGGSGKEVDTGDSVCHHTEDKNAFDQCHEVELQRKTSYVMFGEGVYYVAATVVCSVACAKQPADGVVICPGYSCDAPAWITACKVLGYGAIAADLAGGIATQVIGAQIQSSTAGTVLSGVSSAAGMAGGLAQMAGLGTSGNLTSTTTTAADGTQTSTKQSASKINCPLVPIMDGIQAAIRIANGGVTYAQADRAYKAYKDQQMTTATLNPGTAINGGADGPAGGGNVVDNSKPPVLLRDTKMPVTKSFTASGLATSAATSGERDKLEPGLNAFKNLTGHDPSEIAQGLLDGKSPYAVAAEMAGSNLDQKGLGMLADMDGHKDQILDSVADARKSAMPTGSQTSFASSGSGSSSKSSSSGSTGPDIGALMAGLMGKKGGPEATKPDATNVDFGAAKKIAASHKDGLHTADKSLFEIVGARYQLVQGQFLAGEALPADRIPASTDEIGNNVPKNIYLKH